MIPAATRGKLLTLLIGFVWVGLAFGMAQGQCDCNSVPRKSLQDAARGGPPPRGLRVDSEKDLEQLYAFPGLMSLDLDLRHATRLDLDLARFPGLQCLRLRAPKLELLPEQLKRLEMLCSFSFHSDAEVAGWQGIFTGKTQLIKLTLECPACDISDLQQSGIPGSGTRILTIIGFKGNAEQLLRLLPPHLEAFELDLAPAIDLQKLVAGLKDRERLAKLALHQMNLKKLPEGLEELTALRALDLDQNRNLDLASLADFPETCRRLEQLSLSNLRPPADATPPDTMYRLPRLQMPALRELAISFSKYNRMDFRHFRAPQLTRLELPGDQLVEFPKGLRRFRQLQELNLFGNRLEHIPNYLRKRHLTFLDLTMNRSLPEKEIAKLRSWGIPELRLPEIEDWE